ncbi:1374_t:CDS:1, partial [Acaulospora colombiana]
ELRSWISQYKRGLQLAELQERNEPSPASASKKQKKAKEKKGSKGNKSQLANVDTNAANADLIGQILDEASRGSISRNSNPRSGRGDTSLSRNASISGEVNLSDLLTSASGTPSSGALYKGSPEVLHSSTS